MVRRGKFEDLSVKGNAVDLITHFGAAIKTVIDGLSLKMSKDEKLQNQSKNDLQLLALEILEELFLEERKEREVS